jgi:hypothetical protein
MTNSVNCMIPLVMQVLIQMQALEVDQVVVTPSRDLVALVDFLGAMGPSTTRRQVKKLIQRSCLRHSSVEVPGVEIVDHEKDRIFKCMSVCRSKKLLKDVRKICIYDTRYTIKRKIQWRSRNEMWRSMSPPESTMG